MNDVINVLAASDTNYLTETRSFKEKFPNRNNLVKENSKILI